jgi:glycosyltransferase involved in cell wall biosynthesis
MRWADYVVANSRAGLAAWHIGPARGRVVYNGFDAQRLPSRMADGWSHEGPFTVAMAARMDPAKDFGSFIDAARRLVGAEGPDWRFLAIGQGPSRAPLMAAAHDLLQAGIVEFPDAGLDVLPFVLQAHAGVLMSNPALHAEGCSNAIMEYMACALPVVCSESGGNREVVLHGQTGFVVPPGDSCALAERLSYLRRAAAVARQMGLAGRERLRAAFSAELMVSETLEVYAEAMRLHA